LARFGCLLRTFCVLLPSLDGFSGCCCAVWLAWFPSLLCVEEIVDSLAVFLGP